AAAVIPHAYNTDGGQKELLKKQLDAMPDGGTVLILPPDNPYRCPPGPYERVCMIAHYLKTRKPGAKLIVLDPKKTFSKQALIMEAIERHYKDIVEMNLSNEIDSFAVVRVDPKTRGVETKDGQTWKGDVVNLIPQQRASDIAIKAGCAEGDWCPVKPESFRS